MKCFLCKKKLGEQDKCYQTNDARLLCMDCGGEMIDVYHITDSGSKNDGFYAHNLDHICLKGLFGECAIGDGYTIVKKEMQTAKYYNLEEFTGS